jgi:hypothetical protein
MPVIIITIITITIMLIKIERQGTQKFNFGVPFLKHPNIKFPAMRNITLFSKENDYLYSNHVKMITYG